MIQITNQDRDFHISTDKTSYIIRILDSGHPAGLYYGAKIRNKETYDSLYANFSLWTGSSTSYSPETEQFCLDSVCLEFPGFGKGDYREPAVELLYADGTRVSDFTYTSHRVYDGHNSLDGLPHGFKNGDDVETLELCLSDKITGINAVLSYTVYVNSDIITRSVKIENKSESSVKIEKIMSFNLDFTESAFEMITLDGKWIRERHINSRKLTEGACVIDSKKGLSSANHNPFICLKRDNTSELSGECFGFSIIYSGNHQGLAEVNPHNFTRIQMGISPFDFCWNLKPGEDFQTPEAVLTFSNEGFNGMSKNFHSFVNKNLIPQQWQQKERPILINNWEATYFDFDEKKLIKLAEEAVKLGIELFVLDDGWFGGKRDDDKASLGDWFEDKKKLPGGLERLSRKIHAMGLQFGLWVEPEMINADSNLYREHPEWVIKTPNRPASEGRNQFVLDLANPEVVDFLFETFSDVFRRAELQYVKWDNNRNMSDMFSNALPAEAQQEHGHRYILGLYSLMKRLKSEFPEVLFESCASGGNRFDLGMLYYMPQTWTSDNTDAVERISIQYGTSMLYPPSSMGAHVSAIPSHQVLRNTPLETRFNVAAFGLLGYELDLTKLSNFDKKAIKQQIEFYKEHRMLFQFGDFYRLKSPFEDNQPMWMVVSQDRTEAMLGFYQILQKPNAGFEQYRMSGLNENFLYRIKTRAQFLNIRAFGELINHVAPIKMKADSIVHTVVSNNYMFETEVAEETAFGDELMNIGLKPWHQFMGTGYSEKTRIIGDFGSRIYHIKQIEE